MKERKKQKPPAIQHKIGEKKKREQSISLAVKVAILVFIISVSGFFLHSMLISSQQDQENTSETEPKAAIVDQLSLTAPNQTFKETVTAMLAQAGYAVDYYAGEEVTVEFYKNLPTHGYNLITLRCHSALNKGTHAPVCLFTSETYSQSKYVYEQLTGQVGKVTYLPFQEGDHVYFGLSPKFVIKSMKGRFENTIIIMMGCYGLTYTGMAETFIEKGAKAYLSWNGSVLASHTDQATVELLKDMILKKQTIRQAVENTMKEVGPDPVCESPLIFYPPSVGEQTLKNLTEKSLCHHS